MNLATKITSMPILKGKNETETRLRTAIAGVTLLLVLMTIGGYFGTAIVAAVLTTAMCAELSSVFYSSFDKDEKTKVLLGIGWLIIFVNIFFPKSALECVIVAFIGLFTYWLATAERHAQNLRVHFDEFVFTTFTMMYVVVFMSFLPLVRKGPNGMKWLLLFLFLNWTGDVAAYFGGRKYGKQKLYPLISPNKTVEGAIAGLVGSLVIGLVFKFVAFRDLSFVGALFTSVLVGVFSQIGDLCESFFKRAYGMKDSGRILPGHGGMLDRFDGVLFTLPIMYVCIRIFS